MPTFPALISDPLSLDPILRTSLSILLSSGRVLALSGGAGLHFSSHQLKAARAAQRFRLLSSPVETSLSPSVKRCAGCLTNEGMVINSGDI